MYINKFLSLVSVSFNSVRLHNRINGVHRMTVPFFHLFACCCPDRSLHTSLSPPLSSIWALVVLLGLVLLISKIKYYFRKYGTLPNRSSGLNVRLELRTLILPFPPIVSAILFIIFCRICNMQQKLLIQYSVQWGQISFFSVQNCQLFLFKNK